MNVCVRCRCAFCCCSAVRGNYDCRNGSRLSAIGTRRRSYGTSRKWCWLAPRRPATFCSGGTWRSSTEGQRSPSYLMFFLRHYNAFCNFPTRSRSLSQNWTQPLSPVNDQPSALKRQTEFQIFAHDSGLVFLLFSLKILTWNIQRICWTSMSQSTLHLHMMHQCRSSSALLHEGNFG